MARPGSSSGRSGSANERCSPLVLLDPNSGCRGDFTPPRPGRSDQYTVGRNDRPARPRQRRLRRPSATSVRTTTSRSTTRDCRTRSSAGSTSARSCSSPRPRASLPPPFRPTISASTPPSRWARFSSRPSPRPRRAAWCRKRPTRSARPPPRRRTGRCAISTSRTAGSSGWWIPPPCPGIPRSTSSSFPRDAQPTLPAERGADLPLPRRRQQERGQPEPGRHHGARARATTARSSSARSAGSC